MDDQVALFTKLFAADCTGIISKLPEVLVINVNPQSERPGVHFATAGEGAWIQACAWFAGKPCGLQGRCLHHGFGIGRGRTGFWLAE